jgi:hypothetical protein
VWPDERFGRAFAKRVAPESSPLRIALDDWLTNWLQRVREAGHQIALFPLPGGEGGWAETGEFEDDLRAALESPLPLP